MAFPVSVLLQSLVSGKRLRPPPVKSPFPFFIEVGPKPFYDVVTRAFNIVAAAIGLALLSPLLGLIALLVKLSSPGPILYRGERVGLGERIYTILKFRTMRMGSEQAIGARLVLQEEGHFTPLGRFLRRFRLDELPQLVNVIKGEMSLVGPRPLRPVFLEEHKRSIPGYAKRFSVRPGITGLAQVRGGYYTSPRHKLRYEMLYIAHRSVGHDLKLIALTFLRVMTRIFTTGFILSWLVATLLILPPSIVELFEMQIGAFSFNTIYLVPGIAVVWLLIRKQVIDGRLYLLRTPVDLPCVLFICLSLLGVAFSHRPMTTFRGTLYYFVTGITVFYLVLNTAIVTRQWTAAVRLVSGLATVVAALGLAELFSASRFGPGLLSRGSLYRLGSTLDNPLATAALLILTLPLLLSLFLTARRAAARIAWGLASLTVLATVILSFTRSALVGALLSIWLFLGGKHRHVLVLVAALITLVVLGLSFTGDRRFVLGEALEEAGASIQRQGHLLATFSGKRLLIGVGARTLPVYQRVKQSRSASRARTVSSFGNFYLTMLVEHGVLGFSLFLLIIGLVMKKIRESEDRIPDEAIRITLRAVYAGLAGFLVLLLAFDGLRVLSLEVIFWAALGFGLGLALHASPGPVDHYRVVHFRDRL